MTTRTDLRPTPTRALKAAKVRPVRRSLLRDTVRTYRQVPPGWVALAALLGVGLTGAVALTSGYDPARVMGIAAVLAVLVDVAFRFPSVAATVAVVSAATVLVSPFGLLYAAAATAGRPDPSGALATAAVLFAVTGILAHHTSCGRPWVTTLLFVVSFFTAGPLLLTLAPWFGFGWVWLLSLTILALRGGAPRCAWSRLRRSRAAHAPAGDVVAPAGESGEVGEDATARSALLLDALPASHHALNIGSEQGQIVVGPAGAFLIRSRQTNARVREDLRRGLVCGNVPLADTLDKAATHASDLSARIKTPVTPMVVLHDATLPMGHFSTELISGRQRKASVRVLNASTLVEALTERPGTLSGRQVRRLARRTAKMIDRAT